MTLKGLGVAKLALSFFRDSLFEIQYGGQPHILK